MDPKNKEEEINTKPNTIDKQQSEEDYHDFEDDFEPYETSNED